MPNKNQHFKKLLSAVQGALKEVKLQASRIRKRIRKKIPQIKWRSLTQKYASSIAVGVVAAVMVFNAVNVFQAMAANAELVPDSDVTADWPTTTGTSHYTEVDEGSSAPDTNTYFASDNTDNTSYTNEFTTTTQGNIDEATEITLRIYANTTIQGSDVDTVDLDARINGTLLGSQTVTPSQNSWAWREATWTGTWTQADIDSLQVSMTRNVVGGGNPNGRGDEIRIATVTVDLTYTSAVTLEQSSYRWFENENSTTEPPVDMTELDSITTLQLSGARGVTIDGTTAYVTSNIDDSLTAIDISDPAAMTEIGSITSANLEGARGVTINGTVAYVTSNTSFDDSLTAIDISDPAAMTEIDSITSATNPNLKGAFDVTHSGSVAYVASITADSLTAIDISDPAAMTEIDSITSANLEAAYGVTIDGTTAYVASLFADSLTAIDISNPSNLTELGSITSANLDGAFDVTHSGSVAYVTSISADSLTAIDISNPSNLTEIGSITSANLEGARGVTNSGSVAYVASGIADSLTAIDISNPSAMTELDSFTSANLNGAYGVTIDGSVAYVASESDNSLTAIDTTGGGDYEANIGASLATQDTPVEAPAEGTPFRLRASISADLGDLPAESGNYKLQYAEAGLDGVCDTGFIGETYQDVTTDIGEASGWTEQTANADWSARTDAVMLSYDNKLWVMGGDPAAVSGPSNDVWVSEDDGVNWTQVTGTAAWGRRTFHSGIVFDGKMWIMGGFDVDLNRQNDVWSSTDGLNWTQETASANWPGRSSFTLNLWNNRLYITGGLTAGSGRVNDVWSSSDGINWIQETANAGWQGRNVHVSAVHDNKLWIMSGFNGSSGLNDVWSTSDGANWNEVTSSAGWVPRTSAEGLDFGGKMWVMGGSDGSSRINDVWSSTDGVNWVEEFASAPWAGRLDFSSVASESAIYIAGGEDDNAGISFNDVWRLDFASSKIQFYDNQNIGNGIGIAASLDDPNPGLGNKVMQSYVESNNFTNPNTIPDGDYGIWDFALVDNGAPAEYKYCFRIVNSSGDELQTYSVMPELSIPPPTFTQADFRWYENTPPPALIKEPDPADLPTGAGNGTAFSPDGNYLSVAHSTSPFVTIYEIDAATNTFTKLADPGNLPTGAGNGTAFSPDGNYLSVAHSTSPFVTIYEIDAATNTFTKLADPTEIPVSAADSTAFSSDSNYLSVSSNISPSITVYQIDAATNTFTKFSDPDILPSGNGFGTAFSPDGNYLSVAHNASPYISLYALPELNTNQPLSAQNTTAFIGANQEARLRMLLNVDDKDATASDFDFKLQYAPRLGEVCSSDFAGYNYTDLSPVIVDTGAISGSIAEGSGWTDPENALEPPGSATTTIGLQSSSSYLVTTGYNFSIPAEATIRGIKAEYDPFQLSTLDNYRLTKNGDLFSPTESNNSTSGPYSEYGGPNDLWGTTWSPADINDSSFGAAYSAVNVSPTTPRDVTVNHIRITVYYQLPTESIISYFDNENVSTGLRLISDASDPTSPRSIVNQIYLENNNFRIVNETPGGATAMFDFSIFDDSDRGGSYCFRVVRADGSLLPAYNHIPELGTPPRAVQQMRHGRWFDTAEQARPFYW